MVVADEIGKRLEEIAEAYFDGNKSALARYLGKEPNAFYKYYKGERTPGLEIVAHLGKLGVNVNWFITGRGEMQTNKFTVQDSNLGDEMAEEFVDQENSQKANDFREVDAMELNPAEAELLSEVKKFSNFLGNRPLNPNVKRLLLELLIQSIDQAKEQPPHD